MANKYLGINSLLQYAGVGTSPSAYATIGGVKDIKQSASVTVIDTTTMDITDRTKRKSGALIDEGKMTFQIFADWTDTAGHVALWSNRGQTGYFKLIPGGYPTSPGVTKTFTAVIADISETYPLDNYQVWDLTLDVTGPAVKS